MNEYQKKLRDKLSIKIYGEDDSPGVYNGFGRGYREAMEQAKVLEDALIGSLKALMAVACESKKRGTQRFIISECTTIRKVLAKYRGEK